MTSLRNWLGDRACALRSGHQRRQEHFWLWLGHRLPRPLAYWCCIDCLARATSGPYAATIVPELTAIELLRRTGPP